MVAAGASCELAGRGLGQGRAPPMPAAAPAPALQGRPCSLARLGGLAGAAAHLSPRVRLVCVGVPHLRNVLQLDLRGGRHGERREEVAGGTWLAAGAAAGGGLQERRPPLSRAGGLCVGRALGRMAGQPAGGACQPGEPRQSSHRAPAAAHLAGGGGRSHVAGPGVPRWRHGDEAAGLCHAVPLDHCGGRGRGGEGGAGGRRGHTSDADGLGLRYPAHLARFIPLPKL